VNPRRATVLVVAAIAALALPAIAAAKPEQQRWTEYERPATYEVARDANVPIEMSDGTVLRANVDRPVGPGPFPVLVVQTPYNKDGLVNIALGGAFEYFVRRGYVVVTADVRGTGASGGQWDSFGEAEQRDGAELVEWAAAQPWSTGKVGLMGPSYMGLNQILTAAQRPEHLEAIFPIVPMGDSYRDIVFSGGGLNVSFIPLWLGLVTAGNLTPTPAADDPLGTVTALLSHVAGALNFQIPTIVSATTGGELAYDGSFWKTRSPLELADRVDVPAFVVGGHHDLFQRGEPLIYERLKQHVPARLLMGPWDHLGGSTGAGLPRDGVPALNAIALRWFDHWLLGLDTDVGRIPKATQYVYGAERYRTQADWPDPRLKPRRRYLRGAGGLTRAAPGAGEAPQSFFQDPLTGICTQSTAQWTAGIAAAIPCTTDTVDDESGVASYTTEPLERRLDLSGPILANLSVETTAADAVVTVRVKDVAPSGETTELTAGWLAGSFRAVDRARSRYVADRRGRDARGGGELRLLQPWHPFTRDSVLPVHAGDPVELPVEIFPTRAALKPGHRLKLTVSGGDFPHQLPPLPQLTGSLAGRVKVLTDPEHPSYVELPAIHRHCAGACKPLPVPHLIRGE
jgi:putative CocE/NonD family hydrolase